jgi:hypothetical protein
VKNKKPTAVLGTVETLTAALSGSLWYLHVVVFLSTFAFQLPSPSLPNFVKMLGWGLGLCISAEFSSVPAAGASFLSGLVVIQLKHHKYEH